MAYPEVALVMTEELGLPYGGAYVAVKVDSLSLGEHLLLDAEVEYEHVELFGEKALRVALEDPYMEPGVYALYVTTSTLMWILSKYRFVP